MYLRPTATFLTADASGRTYPEVPSGTAITVTGPKIQQHGLLGLYPVSVPGRGNGFGALNADDFLGCTLFSAPTTPSSRPASATSTTPPASRYPSTAMLDAGGAGTSTSTYAYAAVAFLAVLALGGAVLYSQSSKTTHSGHSGHPKQNRRRNRRHKRSR